MWYSVGDVRAYQQPPRTTARAESMQPCALLCIASEYGSSCGHSIPGNGVMVWYVGYVHYYVIPYILPSSTLPCSHACRCSAPCAVVCTEYSSGLTTSYHAATHASGSVGAIMHVPEHGMCASMSTACAAHDMLLGIGMYYQQWLCCAGVLRYYVLAEEA